MKALVDYTLIWSQPKGMRSEYELRFGNDLVATLKFPKMLSSNAVAEGGDGSWEVERVGVFDTAIRIRRAGHEEFVATYTPRIFKSADVVQLEGGKTLELRHNFWRANYELRAETGEVLMELQSRGFFKYFVDVKTYRKALQYEEWPSLVILVFYVMLMARRDAATHSAVH
jgi:hypothetical protein